MKLTSLDMIVLYQLYKVSARRCINLLTYRALLSIGKALKVAFVPYIKYTYRLILTCLYKCVNIQHVK